MRRHAKQYTHSRPEMVRELLACRYLPALSAREWRRELGQLGAPLSALVWFLHGTDGWFEVGVNNPRTRQAVFTLFATAPRRVREYYDPRQVLGWAAQLKGVRCIACRKPILGPRYAALEESLCEKCVEAGQRLSQFSFEDIVEWALLANIKRTTRALTDSRCAPRKGR